MTTLFKLSVGMFVITLLTYSCDKNDNAPLVADQEFSLLENSETGSFVGTVEAFDPDEGQIITFKIAEGNQEGAFTIDPGTGEIKVSNSSKLDYETIRDFTLEIVVNDNHSKQPMESSATTIIYLLDENEYAPVMNDQNFQIRENPSSGTEIGVIQATDGDIYQHLSYHILSQEMSEFLQIDAASGSLIVTGPSIFDYELNSDLEILVVVEDDNPNSLTDTALITIQVVNIFESTDHLLAYYPFNGNAEDVSGNQYHGNLNGPFLTTGRAEEIDGAYLFDGVDDFIELPPSLALNSDSSFSIEAWVNKEQYTSDGKYTTDGIFGQSDGPLGSDMPHIALFMYPDRTVRGVMRGTDIPMIDLHPEPVMSDNQWHHIVLTRDAANHNLILYLDGELAAEGTSELIGNTTSNDYLSIGAVFDDLESLHHFFCGKIDMVRFFEVALSQEEVRILMSED